MRELLQEPTGALKTKETPPSTSPTFSEIITKKSIVVPKTGCLYHSVPAQRKQTHAATQATKYETTMR